RSRRVGSASALKTESIALASRLTPPIMQEFTCLMGACGTGRGDGEVELEANPFAHLQREGALRVDVRPEQRGEAPPVLVRQLLRPGRFGKNPLEQQVHETRLEQMEREHRGLGVLLVRALAEPGKAQAYPEAIEAAHADFAALHST